MTKPTFLICGGQRCGTTAIWNLLNDHPDVWLAQPVVPEPKFFLSQDNGTPEKYESTFFSDAESFTAVGEKSTSYLEVSGTAERIASVYPDIRLVFMLRHPAERAVSNYLFSKRNGLETREFDLAITQCHEPLYDRTRVHVVSPFSYVHRGQYAELLKPFTQMFSMDQILCLFFEDLVTEPELLCRRLFEFLGVDAEFLPPSLGAIANSGPAWKPIMSSAMMTKLIAAFQDSNLALSSQTGRDLSHWNRLSSRLTDCLF